MPFVQGGTPVPPGLPQDDMRQHRGQRTESPPSSPAVAPHPPEEGPSGPEWPHSHLPLSPPHSFTWLSGHVHRNILSKFTGQAVALFDQEFCHLYAASQPVMGLKCPRLVVPLLPRAGRSPPPGRLSDSSCSASGRLSSNPFSSPSTGSNPQNRLSMSPGPSSPPAPNPPPPPRFQPYHGLWGALAPQAHFSLRPHDSPLALYSKLNACRPPRLQLEQLGLLPRAAHIWRPFLQACPPF